MTERAALVEYLRMEFDRDNDSRDSEAADMLERDGARITELEDERGETRKENEWLRAYTGQSAKACVYCGLGADEQAQCERGFPGCARGDDQMLCPEVGVAIERDEARAALAETRRELLAARKVIASSRVVVEWAEPVTDGDWTEYDAAQRDLREYDAIMRDAPVEVPHGECPYPVHKDRSIKACVEAGDCGCGARDDGTTREG